MMRRIVNQKTTHLLLKRGFSNPKTPPNSIYELGINNTEVKNLEKQGIGRLFPIQKLSFGPLMDGKDIILIAKRSSGKTFAFGLPLLKKIAEIEQKHKYNIRKSDNPLGLVLSSSDENADLLTNKFYDSLPILTIMCVSGGGDVKDQAKELKFGVDLLVGTPERVLQLVKMGSLNLADIRYLLIDDAEKHVTRNLETILKIIPQKPQISLHFSKVSGRVSYWINHLNNNPTMLKVGDMSHMLGDGTTLVKMLVDQGDDDLVKSKIIQHLIQAHAKYGKTIVFTKRVHTAKSLSECLDCEALKGGTLAARK